MNYNKIFQITYFFLFILFISVSFTKIYTFDFYWHLKAGDDILNNLSFHYFDTYSYTKLGSIWFNFHSIFQISISMANKLIGLHGVTILKVFLLFCIYFIIIYKSKINLLHLFILLISIIALSKRSMVRPEIFSYLYIVLIIKLMLKPFEKKQFIVIFIIQLLFTNSHSIFLLGPFIVFIKLFSVFFIQTDSKKKVFELKNYFILLIISLIASLISPYFIKGLFFPFKLLPKVILGENIYKKYILEFSYLNIFSLQNIFYLIYIIIVIVYAVYLFKNKKIFSFFISIFFLLLSLNALRNFNLFMFATLPIIFENKIILKNNFTLSKKITNLINIFIIFVSIFYSYLFATNQYYIKNNMLARFGVGFNDEVFSKKAIKYLKSLEESNKIFNGMSIGGYLIYYAPQLKVFYDGRLDVYGIKHFKEYMNMIEDIDYFIKKHISYGINMVILNHSIYEGLNLLKLRNFGWDVVYLDKHIIILKKFT